MLLSSVKRVVQASSGVLGAVAFTRLVLAAKSLSYKPAPWAVLGY